MAPSSQMTYHKDERVLCFHHEILYEAKILDTRHTDPDDRKSPHEYLVHYKGWKNTCVCPLFRCPLIPSACFGFRPVARHGDCLSTHLVPVRRTVLTPLQLG
jgi:hypothetical protein